MNDKSLMMGLVFGGLLVTALFTAHGEIVLLALPFLLYFGIGIWQSPALDQLDLSIEREVQKTVKQGSTGVNVL